MTASAALQSMMSGRAAAPADWLAQPGAALLHVKVKPMQLVTPPTIIPEAVVAMAVYSVKAIRQGKGHDVRDIITQNVF